MPFISNLYLYLIAFQKSSTPVILKVFKGYLLLCFQEKTSNKSLSERSEQLLGLFKTLCCRCKVKRTAISYKTTVPKKNFCKTIDKSLFIKPHCCGRSVALRVRLVTFLGHSEAATQQGRGAGLFVEGGPPKCCRRGVLESRSGGQLLKLGAGVLNNIEYPNEILPIICTCIHRFRNTEHEEERHKIFFQHAVIRYICTGFAQYIYGMR